MYKSAPRSRFNFVNKEMINNEFSQIIPSKLNDFITQLFVNHSIFFEQEQKNLSLYYFNLRPIYLDSNDSWSSLTSILEKWNITKLLKEEEMTNKFNTY